MTNVDEIVKERLQERIGSVVQDYRNGDLRAEVEAELKRKQLKEKIRHVFRWENISGFNYNLYTLGLAVAKNKIYYNSLQKMGNSYYINERMRAARFVLRTILFILMIGCCVYGGYLLEGLKEYYASNTDNLNYPFSLILAFAFLGVVPFMISLGYVLMVSKKAIYVIIVGLTFAWCLYIVRFLFPELFPQWDIFFGDFVLSVSIGLIFSCFVTSVCMGFCHDIYV